MSYRKYDPEREYWNDGQDEDFTFYKPVRGKKKSDVFRDREPDVPKVYKSAYGSSGGESYGSSQSSGKDYYRRSSYERYGGSQKNYYSSNQSSRYESQRKVYRASNNEKRKPRSNQSTSSTSRYGFNTVQKNTVSKNQNDEKIDDDYDSVLVEEDSEDSGSEFEEEEEFVMKTSPRKSYYGKFSSGYGTSKEVTTKAKNDGYTKRTVVSSRPNVSNSSNYRSNTNQVSQKKTEKGYGQIENPNVKQIKPPTSPKNSGRGTSRITKFTASSAQLGTTRKKELPDKKPAVRRAKIVNKRDDFILPPRTFDRVYFQKNLTTPLVLIQSFRMTVKKNLKVISTLNKKSRNEKTNRNEMGDSQANMIQILRKTPILVASYPQQVKDLEGKLKKNPNDAESLKKLVLCQATLKNYRQARKAIAQVLAIIPKDPLIYDFLSIINEETGRISDALGDLEKLIEYDPKNAEKNRARHRRLLIQWFQDNESEPKLPPSSEIGSNVFKKWTSYARRVIQYWEEQLEDDDDMDDDSDEEVEGEDDKLPVGGEKHACALMECIYYGYGIKKFKLSKRCCERLMKWVNGYSSFAEGKPEMMKKCNAVFAYVAMCQSFVRFEGKEYKEALDDSNMSFRNLQVADDLLVLSKRILLKRLGEVVKKKSKMKNKLKEYAPLQLMWLTENLKMLETLKISMDTKERKELKRGFLMERVRLYIEVMKQHSLSIQDLGSAIRLFPNDPDLYHKRSKVYEELKQFHKAQLDAKKADYLSGGKDFKHFQRRLDMSSPTLEEERSPEKTSPKKKQRGVDPMFDMMFNMRHRLRKMESGDKTLVDYMNIDSVKKGNMEQAIHYLVRLKSRKYFGNIDYQDFIERIENEVKMLKYCQNESILSCCGFKRFSGDSIGICYEFIPEGITLDTFIPRERTSSRKKRPYDYLTPLEKWEMILQLSSIVRQFHRKGIVMRNLNPRGCLVHPSEEVAPVPHANSLGPPQPKIKMKWFDMSYAVMRKPNSPNSIEKLHPKFESTYEKVETHLQRYRAPETIFDHSCSAKSDIFSLGMMIYVIVTSFEPWHELDTKEVLYKIRSGEKPDYELEVNKNKKKKRKKKNNRNNPAETEIDSEFKILIDMCLKDEPSKRPTAQTVYNFAFKKKQFQIMKNQMRISRISKEEGEMREKRQQKKFEKEKEKLRNDFLRKERKLEERFKSEISKRDSEKSKLMEELRDNKKRIVEEEEEEQAKLKQKQESAENDIMNEENKKMMEQMKNVCRSLENLRNLFQCPISLELFEDPYMLVESGGVYEKTMINKWLKKNRTDPITNQVVLSKKRVPLKHLKNIIEEWKKTQALLESTNLK